MTVLSVRDLSVTTELAALVQNVSFDIHSAEILAIVGESGSGKTLTALSVMGLLPSGLSRSGDIVFEGAKDATQPSSLLALRPSPPLLGRDIAMIFQEPMTSLNPLHTIGKQIGEAIRIYNPGLTPSQIEARVVELLAQVQLAHFATRLKSYPHQLSGGERQRVMIAMAIANRPSLLIADEPTTALDVTIQAQILSLLKELRQTLGMSILLITHDLAIVRQMADRVCVMTEGKGVETGKVKDIFNAPQHSYTKHLLASEVAGAPLPAPQNAPLLLSCDRLCVSYAVSRGLFTWKQIMRPVLSDVTLQVPAGTTLGIVGESGSGKTSLALALLRLIQSDGTIIFLDSPINLLRGNALRTMRRHLQIVFQDPFGSLNPRMTIGAIIQEGLDVHEPTLSVREREEKVEAILSEVGLTPQMKHRYPHEFSGGQRQRVSIARALILRPKLIILDEPTSALDVSVQAQIIALLKNVQQKHGLSYIYISHDLRTIRAMSHFIVVLKEGRVVESGASEQVLNHPQKEYTKTLLEAAFA